MLSIYWQKFCLFSIVKDLDVMLVLCWIVLLVRSCSWLRQDHIMVRYSKVGDNNRRWVVEIDFVGLASDSLITKSHWNMLSFYNIHISSTDRYWKLNLIIVNREVIAHEVRQDWLEFGFLIAEEKSDWKPRSCVKWLGFEFDFHNGALQASRERIYSILDSI